MPTDVVTAGSSESAILEYRASVERALERVCETRLGAMTPSIAEAVRYALLGGGKRLRGALVMCAYRAAGGNENVARLAAAVEIVHAYSLVHDDLPCMDDDDMRRGRATTHKVFGVPVAVAAGLAMVPLAASEAFAAAIDIGLSVEGAGAIVQELMRAAGGGGMIGGQLLDLEGEGLSLGLAELERIHRLKTGALIAASAVLGGRAADASPVVIEALRSYGAAIGLAFQIADDVLDVTQTTDVLGKTAGRDVELRKSTYPALLGVAGAPERAHSLVAEACGALHRAGVESPALEYIAHFSVERRS